MDQKLIKAVQKGKLKKFKHSIENITDIHADDDYALRFASKYEHLEVVKYLKSLY